ncbi:MAG: hypothetical protein GX621_09200 [Pirellulaceae bacterium]|nr:hypothetical protein [Pirellulaceae bacterium]
MPTEPAVVDATPFVGPLPISSTCSARQPIQPVPRIGSPKARSLEELLIETPPESSTAILDAALSEEYGPAIEPTGLLNRHAAWSSMVARRQSNRRDGGELDRTELAVDLLMAGRRG